MKLAANGSAIFFGLMRTLTARRAGPEIAGYAHTGRAVDQVQASNGIAKRFAVAIAQCPEA
jgi:hypothetical protein